MRTPAVWGASAVVLVVAAAVLGVAADPGPTTPPGSTLGPASGSPVAQYVAAAGADLADADGDGPRWALLAPDDVLTPQAAAGLAAGTRTSRVLLRVPVTDVQTPLLSEEVADQGGVAALAAELATLQQRAGSALRAGSGTGTGADRAARVDALVAARLGAGCTCIVGLLVRGTPQALRVVAARTGVRALQPAPADAGYGQLAVSPLLPGQVGTVGPGRDDGEVPAS